jgi:hypothetical protein
MVTDGNVVVKYIINKLFVHWILVIDGMVCGRDILKPSGFTQLNVLTRLAIVQFSRKAGAIGMLS